jgi:hypothetical protein
MFGEKMNGARRRSGQPGASEHTIMPFPQACGKDPRLSLVRDSREYRGPPEIVRQHPGAAPPLRLTTAAAEIAAGTSALSNLDFRVAALARAWGMSLYSTLSQALASVATT